MKRKARKGITLLLGLASLLWTSATIEAQPNQGSQGAPGHGVAVAPVDPATVPQIRAREPQPRSLPRGHDIDLRQWKQLLRPGSPLVPPDPSLIQDQAAPSTPAPLSASFAGISYTGWFPPDPHLAAGPTELVAAVNTSFAFFNKTGTNLFQTTMQTWFSNVLPGGGAGFVTFDPRVIYDTHLRRFILMAAAVNSSSLQAFWALSFSPISSATSGSWCNLATDATLNGTTPTSNFNDYPRIGFDTRGVYLTANMFNFSTGFFQYVKTRVLNKTELKAILNAGCSGSYNYYDFFDLRNPSDNSLAFTVNPVASYGDPAVEYLVNSRSGTGSTITLWRLAGANLIPASPPTLTRVEIPVTSYTLPPDATQPGGAPAIDTGDARLFGAVLGAAGVWTAQTISCDFGGGPLESCIRVYVLDPDLEVQEWVNTLGAQDLFYFYPDIAPDPFGNPVVAFSRSGASVFAEARFTRKRVAKANLNPDTALLQAGAATYQQIDSFGRNRWGDYFAAAVDPDDPRTLWFVAEYVAAMNVWGTRIGATRFAP